MKNRIGSYINIIPAVVTVYKEEDTNDITSEVMLIAHIRSEHSNTIMEFINGFHSYELPQMYTVPVSKRENWIFFIFMKLIPLESLNSNIAFITKYIPDRPHWWTLSQGTEQSACYWSAKIRSCRCTGTKAQRFQNQTKTKILLKRYLFFEK